MEYNEITELEEKIRTEILNELTLKMVFFRKSAMLNGKQDISLMSAGNGMFILYYTSTDGIIMLSGTMQCEMEKWFPAAAIPEN